MATVDPFVLDQMALAYQQAVSRVHIAAEAAAQDAWFGHDSFGSEDDEEWNAIFWGIVLASATTVAAISREYLQTQLIYTGYTAPLPSPDMDWLESDFANYANSPAVYARWLISEGSSPAEAMSEAASRVTKLTSAVVREAEQVTIDQMVSSTIFEVSWEFDVDDRNPVPLFPATVEDADRLAQESGHRVTKRGKGKSLFKRVPQANACGWCRVVADRLYSLSDGSRMGAWHTFCRCTWRKVTTAEAGSFQPQYGDGQWRTVVNERFQEGDE